MTFTFTISVWDYAEALRLHRVQNLGRRMRFSLSYWIIPILSAAGLVLLGAADIRVRTLGGWLLESFAVALLWIGIAQGFMHQQCIRREVRRRAPLGETTICVDDDSVLIRVPGKSETKMFWTSFVGSARNEKLLLLYTTKDCFLIFPISGMPPERQAELSATIERNLIRS